MLDREPELVIHRRGAARDRVRARHARDPVDDIDGQRPEPVTAVGHPRGGHRVGHQRHPVRPGAAADMPVQGGIDVHAVGDQFHRHPRVLEQRDHRAGLAGVDRAHRVEQMRRHRRTRVDRRARLRVVASVWPTAATTPASTICRIAARAPSRSGAMVTMRIAPAAGLEDAVDLGGIGITHQ